VPVRETNDTPKLTRLEVLGAWLGVWTPPRGAVLPPVPWPKVALGAAILAVVAVLVAVLGAPAIDEAKTESAATERRAEDERRAARRERQRREQRPRLGRLVDPGARGRALVSVEAAIGRDARRRFNPRAAPATCDATPGADATAPRVAYDCLSSVRAIVGAADQEGARGELGIPYRAVLDFERGRYAFCRVTPIPGEQIVPDPRSLVEIPRPCRIPRS
jgi:hypothetical protein